nr:MAG TPA: hypothetical protein [Caudoviricetes sp.]
MTNFEFYESEIKSRGFSFAVDKSSGELFCCGQEGSCDKCEFCPDTKGLLTGKVRFVCSKINIIRWLYQEHKIKMNALEYGLLKYMLSQGFEWVSRDDDFTITFFTLKPVDKDGTWFSPRNGADEPLNCDPLCEELFEFLREDELFNINELFSTCEVTE